MLFTPDGRHLLTAGMTLGAGAAVKVWDAEFGHELLALTPDPRLANPLLRALSQAPDGRRFAVALQALAESPAFGQATLVEIVVWDARPADEEK